MLHNLIRMRWCDDKLCVVIAVLCVFDFPKNAFVNAARTHNDTRVENVNVEAEEWREDERIERKNGKCVFCACEWNRALYVLIHSTCVC